MTDKNNMATGSPSPYQGVPTKLNALEQRKIRQSQEKEVSLPNSYELKQVDVICGNRGLKETYSHVGNKRFRVVVDMQLERYKNTETRKEKSDIVKEIVETVRSMGGGFVRCENGNWYDIGNARAREKVGNAIRSALQKQKQMSHFKSATEEQSLSQTTKATAAKTNDSSDSESRNSGGYDSFDDFVEDFFSDTNQKQTNIEDKATDTEEKQTKQPLKDDFFSWDKNDNQGLGDLHN